MLNKTRSDNFSHCKPTSLLQFEIYCSSLAIFKTYDKITTMLVKYFNGVLGIIYEIYWSSLLSFVQFKQ